MLNPMNLEGKRIILTGASSGIGRETALLVSKLGALVIAIARREEELKKTLSSLEPNAHCYYNYDLSNVNGIEALIERIVRENGKLDGLVHCAGITGPRPLKLTKPDFLLSVLMINYFSYVELVRCITKNNHFNEGLSIVGISSISSLQGQKARVAYCSSKAALDAASRCMAKELAPKNIRVNTILPSFIETELYQEFIDSQSSDADYAIARQYLGVGKPLDVANMVAFLLSSASAFTTGASLPVDGGRLSS